LLAAPCLAGLLSASSASGGIRATRRATGGTLGNGLVFHSSAFTAHFAFLEERLIALRAGAAPTHRVQDVDLIVTATAG
ncbi:MAG: hypothetical protein GWO24_37610, partial [Akkermansiaceae bacterium]|nr:hypothetical protein [Akkermansiaceae bacterium]